MANYKSFIFQLLKKKDKTRQDFIDKFHIFFQFIKYIILKPFFSFLVRIDNSFQKPFKHYNWESIFRILFNWKSFFFFFFGANINSHQLIDIRAIFFFFKYKSVDNNYENIISFLFVMFLFFKIQRTPKGEVWILTIDVESIPFFFSH